tara:strand:- start:127 stop:675 length:549 start_codon:yes stop_codon:yes gene_type:complete
MARGFYIQKITTGDKTQVTYDYHDFSSITFTNTHTSEITMTLYLTSQLGSDITDTDTDINLSAGYGVTTYSQAIVVDNGGTAATADAFLNEKVYLSTGLEVGTCTAFGSATSLTFGGGITNTLVDNASLYTGSRYEILKAVEIPAGTALKLHPEDFNFNTDAYKMYINSGNASGLINIMTRY